MFSPPPLKFRTAGFPQYGFKQEFDRDLRYDARKAKSLIRGQSLVRLPPVMDLAVKTSPRGEAEVEAPQDQTEEPKGSVPQQTIQTWLHLCTTAVVGFSG